MLDDVRGMGKIADVLEELEGGQLFHLEKQFGRTWILGMDYWDSSQSPLLISHISGVNVP